MDCPNCGQPLEPGAAFCGNCGHAVETQSQLIGLAPAPHPAILSPKDDTISRVLSSADARTSGPVYSEIGSPLVAASLSQNAVPAYAIPAIGQQRDHMKAALAVIFGSLAIAGGLIVPVMGLVFGLTGIVLGTISRRYLKHPLGLTGIVLSLIGIIASLGMWVYVVSNSTHVKQTAHTAAVKTNTSPVVAANEISTPCYDVNFVSRLNVQNNNGSCNMNAFDGSTFEVSNSAYKVFATNSGVSMANFPSLAKTALERDVKESLPAFHITNEQAMHFSGSPAYVVTTNNGEGVSVVEAAIYHPTPTNTNNFFVIVYATTNGMANLHDLELGWQWK